VLGTGVPPACGATAAAGCEPDCEDCSPGCAGAESVFAPTEAVEGALADAGATLCCATSQLAATKGSNIAAQNRICQEIVSQRGFAALRAAALGTGQLESLVR